MLEINRIYCSKPFDFFEGFIDETKCSSVNQEKTIWTIGHSTRSWEEFVGLLQSTQIELLADVRTYPGSRKYPQFNKENLEQALPRHEIQYLPVPLLGGRRRPDPASLNVALRHPAFRAYADYMETEDFRPGIEIVTQEASAARIEEGKLTYRLLL